MRGLFDIFNRWWNVLGKQRGFQWPYIYNDSVYPTTLQFWFGNGTTQTKIKVTRIDGGVTSSMEFICSPNTKRYITWGRDANTPVVFDQVEGVIKYLWVNGNTILDV